MISYDICMFRYYSLVSLLNRLNDLSIEVKKYFIINENEFYLKINRKYRKKIKENFKDFKIVDKIGFINNLEKLILKPITLVSLILAISLFFNLSNKIYEIELKGDFPSVEQEIMEFLNSNNIKKFSSGIDTKNTKKIETLLKENFFDKLEFIEVLKDGATLSINYKKRRKSMIIEGKKGSLYATKDGVIKGFSLLSGVKNVRVYQYVRKGDLLVNDILLTSDNESIVIGTIGKVFASTFYYIEVNSNIDLDVASKQAYLLNLARNEVSKNINSDDEYIESENILINDVNKGYMKIYYVLYEDITI